MKCEVIRNYMKPVLARLNSIPKCIRTIYARGEIKKQINVNFRSFFKNEDYFLRKKRKSIKSSDCMVKNVN